MTSGDPSTQVACGTGDALNPAAERRRTLAPYLARLAVASTAQQAEPAVPESLPVEGASLELDPWERRVLQQFHGGTDTKGRPWPGLVAEGVAFRAKCLARAAQLEPDAEPQAPQHRAGLVDELIHDAAVGLALMQELQQTIDRLIHESELKIAKGLTDFRNVVGQSVGTMRKLLGSEAFAAATTRAPALVSPPPKEPARAEEPKRKAPEQFKKDLAPVRVVSRRMVRRNLTLWLLMGVLLLSIAGWVVTFVLTRTSYVPPPVLTADQFRHVESFRGVTARPPSLYVMLDAEGWTRMSPQRRREVLDEIGGIAARAGYVGVHARTTDSVPVGQWLKARGVRLFAPPTGGT